MGTELVAMSTKEVVRRVVEGRITQAKAGEFMGLSERQLRRLCAAFEERGPAGLVSGKRGQLSNRRLPDELRAQAVEIVRERYADFGPTLACEKLLEQHALRVSKETLRAWLIGAGVWIPRRERTRTAHQPRHRRECLGELVQIDGCEHAWFEERGPGCTLLVYVDDATSRLMELRFVNSESAFDYFASTHAYLERHGKPVAFYSDKHSIFRVHHDGSTGRARGVTQFGRALTELNIDIICANSPQAKGRVERMNKTLQDRLVKELRLRGISTMEAGNAFLPEFMADYNQLCPSRASASASSSGTTDESRSAARADCFPTRHSTRTDASTRARWWRTSGSAQSCRSSRLRSSSGTRCALHRSSSLFERRSASGLLASPQGHPCYPSWKASAKWLRSSRASKRNRERGRRRTTIEPPFAAKLSHWDSAQLDPTSQPDISTLLWHLALD